jgi:alpha-beta hydrolase superfamily lysophospholipase
MRVCWLVAWVAILLNATAGFAQEAYPLTIPTPRGAPAPAYQKHSVRARDDTKLIVHEWAPPKVRDDKPVILFLHGIGMHGQPYASIAFGFTSQGIVFAVPDLRGHGLSEGPPGQLATPQVLRADLGAMIAFLNKRHPKAQIVLAGESMGGLIAADYAWRGEQPLAGLVLLAPAFRLHPLQAPSVVEFGKALGMGEVSLDTDDKLKPSTRMPGFIKARQSDGLALRKVPSSYLLSIATLQQAWPQTAAQIKVPLFVCVASKDRIVDGGATRRVYEAASTPQRHKTWRELDGAYHTVCWDPMALEWVAEVGKWAEACQNRHEEKGPQR